MSDPAIEICYVEGGAEKLPLAAPLWKELNKHIQTISAQFSETIAERTFEARRAELVEKSGDGQWLRVDLAKTAAGDCIGYCIATIDRNRTGEIDSIFVQPSFRKRGIGDALMQRALNWMDAEDVRSRILEVTWGNERVWSFYRRYGFLPRAVRFVRKATTRKP